MRRLHEEHGEIVYYELPFMKCCAVFDADLIREILVTRQPGFPPWFPGALNEIIENGAVALHQGDEQRQRSEFMMSAFSEARVEAYADIMVEKALDLCGRCHSGQVLDVVREMEVFIWDALVGIILGRDMRVPRHVGQDILDFQKVYLILDVLPGRQLLKKLPLPAFRRGYRSVRMLDDVMYGAMQSARGSSYSGSDVITHYVHASDNGRLDGVLDNDRAIRDEIIILLTAFVDAPTGALAFGIHHLARHPEVREKLEHEIDEVLADRRMEASDYERLPYARAVLDEILRLEPPAPVLLPKEALEDCELGGYLIPKGTLMHVGLLELHREAEHWQRAGEFVPERWLEDPRPPRPPCPEHGYIPFGQGPHSCKGTEIAKRLFVFGIVSLMQRFRLEPARDVPPRRNDMAVGVTGPWLVNLRERRRG